MINKILIGAGIFCVGRYISDIIALSEEENNSVRLMASFKVARNNIGKVVKSADSDTLYLLWGGGSRVEYVSYQAYLNDGKKEIIVVSSEILKFMGLVTNAKIYESGFKWDDIEI